MRCCARASCSVKDLDSRTALSATSTLRPRRETTERISAAASFSIFCFISSSDFTEVGPKSSTGCAAPALVPGAMAATSAAGRDVEDDRNLGIRDLLDDTAGRFDEASRRIDLDQYSLIVAARSFVD